MGINLQAKGALELINQQNICGSLQTYFLPETPLTFSSIFPSKAAMPNSYKHTQVWQGYSAHLNLEYHQVEKKAVSNPNGIKNLRLRQKLNWKSQEELQSISGNPCNDPCRTSGINHFHWAHWEARTGLKLWEGLRGHRPLQNVFLAQLISGRAIRRLPNMALDIFAGMS